MFRSSALVATLAIAAAAQVHAAPTTLTVGIYPSYPPLDVKDPATGKLGGFDVALEAALAKRMGVTFKLQETSFSQFVTSVQTGRIDLFLNGMNDTAKRREVISFVDYLQSGTQFMVSAKQAGQYKVMTDLCGKTVAASRGTNAPNQIAEWSKAHCEAAGKPAIKVFGAENSIDARRDVTEGRVDAMAQDSLTIPYIRSQAKGQFATVGAPFDNTVMGIGLGKDDTKLAQSLKTALQAMIDDGSYAKLLANHGLPATSAVAKATINQGQ
ncbi:ABC transporter substrate-binding protein [Acidimangrovimonas sediminis]|uniref:ABC transporter substrate-binding protein n=1 Tax=Acidimangrovimonas sediminis TaxID=2056283 RepID=UPI000C7F8728|nr:ABC transporter substrate-binding protein [Acidimangrovimonas sediminis]